VAVLIAEILLSLFAVFGLYAAVRLFALWPCRAYLSVAVELRAPLTPEEGEQRLACAQRQFFPEGYPVVLLIDAALAADPAFRPLLEAADACFVMEGEDP